MNPEKIKSFKDLNVWREGHQLAIMIYRATRRFPKEEQFGLTNQMRRAAVSVTSNIAEGFSRNSYKEKAHFYSTALGSLTELQAQALLAHDVGFLPLGEFSAIENKSITVNKLCNGLIKKTREFSES